MTRIQGGAIRQLTAMSSTHSLSGVDDTSDEAVMQGLTQAISKLSTTPRKTQKSKASNDTTRIWKSQIDRYSQFFPNAAYLFSKVKLPSDLELCDGERVKQFVSSTSITPDGKVFPPQSTDVLNRRLWLADEYTGTNRAELVELGITHIVCLGRDDYHAKGCSRVGFVEHAVLQVPAPEALYDVSLVGIIDNGISFVRRVLAMDPMYRVLIHCKRGDNWGAGIATGVIMDQQGYDFGMAYRYVQVARPNVVLHDMVARAVQQWWTLEKLRPELPQGRGYRPFKWARDKDDSEE